MEDPDEFSGVPVKSTGLLCTLGSYAARGEFLTDLVAENEAENVKAQMKTQEVDMEDAAGSPWHVARSSAC